MLVLGSCLYTHISYNIACYIIYNSMYTLSAISVFVNMSADNNL